MVRETEEAALVSMTTVTSQEVTGITWLQVAATTSSSAKDGQGQRNPTTFQQRTTSPSPAPITNRLLSSIFGKNTSPKTSDSQEISSLPEKLTTYVADISEPVTHDWRHSVTDQNSSGPEAQKPHSSLTTFANEGTDFEDNSHSTSSHFQSATDSGDTSTPEQKEDYLLEADPTRSDGDDDKEVSETVSSQSDDLGHLESRTKDSEEDAAVTEEAEATNSLSHTTVAASEKEPNKDKDVFQDSWSGTNDELAVGIMIGLVTIIMVLTLFAYLFCRRRSFYFKS